MSSDRRLPHPVVGIVLLALIVLSATIGWIWWDWSGRHHVWQTDFDASAWKRADPLTVGASDNYRTARSHMIEDLLARHDFRGWPRQQVVDLLGEPTRKWFGFEQWDVIYVLGLERNGAFSLDDEALGFNFDDAERVVDYGLSVN